MRSILATSQPVARESYITNLDGEIVQHVEYLPFGEVFIEERNNSWNTPYLFNGKELDEETGLYYYGARYYNPRESVWLSADPLSGYNPVLEREHYIDGQHNGGVYNSFNLNTYIYCYQSPIRYIDPNGKQVDVITETKGTGHTFVSIGNGTNRTVYNYGRYNGGTWYTGGTSGAGILLKFEGKEAANYIRTELYRMEAKVFRIKNADENAVRKFFEDKYNQGNKIDSDSKDINTFGREIDKYFILSNNCTTLSIKGIKAGGSDVFDGDGFIIPKSLQNFLEKSDNPNITNITSYYKNIYANSNNNEALGSSTGSAGTTSGSGASSAGSSSNNLSTGRGYSSGLSLGFSSN